MPATSLSEESAQSRRAITQWLQQNQLSPVAAEHALQLSGELPDGTDWKNFLEKVFLFSGVLFLAAGVIFFFAFNWDVLPRLAKFSVLQGLLIAAALLARHFTVDTLKKLRAGLGSHSRVFVIVGIDAFLGIRQWRGTAELLTLAEWIVVTRPGFAMEAVEAMGLSVKERMVVHLLGGVSEMASATLVRERLRSGEGCEDLVPANVLAYIREKHLYGT